MFTSHKYDKKQSRKETLDNVRKHFNGREMIINTFENDFFPLPEQPPSFQEEDGDKDLSK